MNKVKLIIDDHQIEVDSNLTILDAAKTVGINVPTLCHLNLHNTKMVNQNASCRVCVVEIKGRRNLAPSCSTLVQDGMVINTSSGCQDQ